MAIEIAKKGCPDNQCAPLMHTVGSECSKYECNLDSNPTIVNSETETTTPKSKPDSAQNPTPNSIPNSTPNSTSKTTPKTTSDSTPKPGVQWTTTPGNTGQGIHTQIYKSVDFYFLLIFADIYILLIYLLFKIFYSFLMFFFYWILD